MISKLEIVILVGAAMWLNFQWNYVTPRPKHAWHHRADGHGHWHFTPGRHRSGFGAYAAAGRAS